MGDANLGITPRFHAPESRSAFAQAHFFSALVARGPASFCRLLFAPTLEMGCASSSPVHRRTAAPAELAASKSAPYSEVPLSFPRASGSAITGTLTVPSTDAQHNGVVVCTHGLFSHKDHNHAPTLAAMLATELGLHVYRFDFLSGADYVFPGFQTDLSDLESVIAALQKEKGLQTVALFGHSKGANVVLMHAAKHAGDLGAIRAVVAHAPRFHMSGMLTKLFGPELLGQLDSEGGSFQWAPKTDGWGPITITRAIRDGVLALDMGAVAAALPPGLPVLIAHGTLDQTITHKDSDAWRAARGPQGAASTTVLKLKQCGHKFEHPGERAALLEATREAIARACGIPVPQRAQATAGLLSQSAPSSESAVSETPKPTKAPKLGKGAPAAAASGGQGEEGGHRKKEKKAKQQQQQQPKEQDGKASASSAVKAAAPAPSDRLQAAPAALPSPSSAAAPSAASAVSHIASEGDVLGYWLMLHGGADSAEPAQEGEAVVRVSSVPPPPLPHQPAVPSSAASPPASGILTPGGAGKKKGSAGSGVGSHGGITWHVAFDSATVKAGEGAQASGSAAALGGAAVDRVPCEPYNHWLLLLDL